MKIIKQMLGITTKEEANVIKKYFLWIPLITIVNKRTKRKIYLLGIRLFNIKKSNKEKETIIQYRYEAKNEIDARLTIYESLQKYFSLKHDGKVAVIGVLPPENTGIALFNASLFANRKYFDCFTNTYSLSKLFYAYSFNNSNDIFNIYTTGIYKDLDLSSKYKSKIFVLGNSYHNVPYLQLATTEKDKKNSWLHIHEANLLSLFFNYLNKDIKALHKWISVCYPEKYDLLKHFKTWETLAANAKYHGLYGVRLIKTATGINNFIVNNDVCEKIVLNEINDDDLVVKKLFLPFPDLKNVKPYAGLPNDCIYIASWGIPGGSKLTHLVADAVCLLNEKFNIPAKLLLGGYSLTNYCTYDLSERQKANLVYFDSPSDDELFSLMKRAEISVQLREHPHGESSGPISQLFGMNKKVITNEGFIDSEFEKYCYVLPIPVTAEALALKLKKALVDNDPNYDKLVQHYSFDNLAQELANLS